MDLILSVLHEAWNLLLESSVYIIFGLMVSGLLRVFLNPNSVGHHFGQGRFLSVFKAALIGIPIPLCSCGVLPAAVSLRKQGANNGATTAFMISTPESSIDSIAITFALIDPIMTVARPVVAFFTAAVAGVAENLFSFGGKSSFPSPDLTCPVDGCCDGIECPPEEHSRHHNLLSKFRAGLYFALTELWGDLAGWFLIGLILAGLITAVISEEMIVNNLGGGIQSMLIMLVVGIPLYVCATASTPIAAALILKGVSPGAALVFLLAGPATNVTSLTVLLGILGKRATTIYIASIAFMAVFFGLALDQIYASFGISAQAVVGQAVEIMPVWAEWAGAIFLLFLSVKPIFRSIMKRFKSEKEVHHEIDNESDLHAENTDISTCFEPD